MLVKCPECKRNYECAEGGYYQCVCGATFYVAAGGAVLSVVLDDDRTMPPRRQHRAPESEELDRTIPPRRRDEYVPPAETAVPGGAERQISARFAPGDLIMGRYKVVSELGQGGMGVVYKCFDETAGIEVALKALPPELSHNTLEMEDIRDNFQLVAKLVHQNIAISKNLERDNSNGDYYLIMECVEGEDLRRWIKRKRQEPGGLKLADALPVLSQVAAALDYAHGEGVIHRDIKPGNIMIDRSGHVKVLDFGLAAQIHTSMTRVSMAYRGTSGTGPYMAPEQWRGEPQDAAADQYALAVMTYEMLAGRQPFESPDVAVLQQAVLTQKAGKIPGVPKAVQSALDRALSKVPKERFSCCSDFVSALGGEKIRTAKKSLPHSETARKPRRLWWWIGGAAALLLVLVVAAAVAVWQPWKTSVPGFSGVPGEDIPDLYGVDEAFEEFKKQYAKYDVGVSTVAEWKEEERKQNIYSNNLLGECYFWGKGGQPQDYGKAIDIWRRKDDRVQLGFCYYYGYGVNKNLQHAFSYFKDFPELAGYCYYYGKGVDRDCQKAAICFDKGSNSYVCKFNLGCCYYRGRGVEQSFEKAVKLWEVCQRYSDCPQQIKSAANYALGVCYYHGRGVEKNLARAERYWIEAGDYAPAKEALKKF